MSIQTQGIASLGAAVQQHNGEPLAAIKADQARTLTASDTQHLEFQRHLADTSSGSITITLKPAADWPKFVPFHFQKVSASNSMIIDGDGSETVDGSATIAVTGNGTVISLYSDGTTIRRYIEGGAGGGVAGAALVDLSNVSTQQLGIGDSSSSPNVTLSKSGTGTADFGLKSAGTLRGRLRLDASENVVLSVHDGSGVLLGSITLDNTTGRISVAGGLTISSGTLRAGLTEYANNAAALGGGLVAGDTYILAATKALTVVT